MAISENSQGHSVPPSAIWLGGTGALPFVALSAMTVLADVSLAQRAVFALTAYGAVILSFLGGIQWGSAMSARPPIPAARLVVSVLPSLAAWAALLIAPRMALWILAGLFVGVLFIDLRATKQGFAPAWFPKLRVPLTIVVVASLIIGALMQT